MVLSTLSSPASLLGCSPPAKSPSVPIKRLSRSVPAQDAAEASCQRPRTSADAAGSRKLSFGHGKTPFSASLASAPARSAARPPAGPSAVRGSTCVGFSPAGEGAAPCAPAGLGSPGRRATKSSLLSQALLDAPAAVSSELYGAAAPSRAFEGLVVLPDRLGGDVPADAMPALLDLQAQHPVFSSGLVTAAFALAARAHAGQARKSGEPVLAHLAATALILAELGLPEEVVAAGLLHDVLCDTPTQPWQLHAAMPEAVVALVTRVSQLNQLSQAYRDNTHSLEAEAMLDMLTGMEDVSALLIKLADRLHNMRTVGALSRCKQVRMASETLDVFAVLANRLGAWAVKAELEDLSFKTLNPEEYEAVAGAIAARSSPGAGGSDLAAGIEELTGALAGAGLEVVDVSGRVKNVYGVWKKVQKNLKRRAERAAAAAGGAAAAATAGGASLSPSSSSDGDEVEEPGSPLSPAAAAAAAPAGGCTAAERAEQLAAAVAEVYDIQALRVVVPHKHDCYAALRVVQGVWEALPGRLKDYIRCRKPNGYQSLHLTVRDGAGRPLEVQIRTPKMHYIAEYGFAAHWKYKERLGRQDVWLERLVQWKKWVASEKLGIADRKLRPSGSPGGAGGDAALAGLAERLGLEAAAGGSSSSAAAATGAPLRGESPGAAFSEALAAALAAAGADAPSRRAAPSAFAAAAQPAAALQADEKFAARFRMQPISESEVDQHGAAVMISGPRGVSIAQLPARCTVGQLLGSGAMGDQLRRAGSGGLSAALGQQGLGGGAAPSAAGGCRLAVNGVVVMPGQAEEVVLRSGDQVQVLEGPTLQPLVVLGGSGGHSGPDAGGAQQQPDAREAALPGAMAGAGETLGLFVPGQQEPLEVALRQKLRVSQRVPARSRALVS